MAVLRSVSARAMAPVFALLRMRNVDVHALVAAYGIDPRWVDDLDRRVTSLSLDGFWERCAQVTEDDAFGLHVAELSRAETFGVVSYLTITSSTVGEGLRRGIAYFAVLAQGITFELREQGDVAQLVRHDLSGGHASSRHDVECSLATVFIYASQFASRPFVPQRVCFPHPRPERTDEHGRIFAAPLVFDASEALWEVDRRVLDIPMARADHSLSVLLEGVARERLDRLMPFTELREQVDRHVQDELAAGRLATLDGTARALARSRRSLQRELTAAGTSFRLIVDEVRRSQSRTLLAQPQLSVMDVAFMLGFSGQSAFQRSFRRWFGITPTAFRATLPPPTH